MDDIHPQLPRSAAAIAQLEHALHRLEGALAQDAARAEAHLDWNVQQNHQLNIQLQAARAEYRRLEGAARQVEDRLNGAILRLKTLLEG